MTVPRNQELKVMVDEMLPNMIQSPFKRIENYVKITKKQMNEVKRSPGDPKQRVREKYGDT